MQIQRTDTGVTLKGDDTTLAVGITKSDAPILIPFQDTAPKKDQTILDWPGEYEARGVMVRVMEIGKEHKGIVAKIIQDDISLLFVRSFGDIITEAEEELIGTVDILIAPADEPSAKKTQQLAEALEPKMLIPYGTAADTATLAKAFGAESPEPTDTLKVKKSDLTAEKIEVRLLA